MSEALPVILASNLHYVRHRKCVRVRAHACDRIHMQIAAFEGVRMQNNWRVHNFHNWAWHIFHVLDPAFMKEKKYIRRETKHLQASLANLGCSEHPSIFHIWFSSILTTTLLIDIITSSESERDEKVPSYLNQGEDVSCFFFPKGAMLMDWKVICHIWIRVSSLS